MLNTNELKISCSMIAETVNYPSTRPPLDYTRELSAKFYSLALEKAKLLEEEDKDVEMINRAVWYISLVRAGSPSEDHMEWFRDLLEALLWLARLDSPLPDNHPQKFLQGLLLGGGMYRNGTVGLI